MKEIFSIKIQDKEALIAALLSFSPQYEDFCVLNSNEYEDVYGMTEILCGMGSSRKVSFAELMNTTPHEQKDWIFLHMSYDLKNQLEKLSSDNPVHIEFDDISGFVPEFLFELKRGSKWLKVFSATENTKELQEKLENALLNEPVKASLQFPKVQGRIDPAIYIKKIEALLSHIQEGNIYEANFCMEFFAEEVHVNPEELYLLLNSRSPAPFSAFYKRNDKFLLSATPERFLAKRGKKLISQPIKGTARRGLNLDEDERLKKALAEDLKEQTENVMIVDVVRNDLSRIAERGSVKVEELCGIYTYPQVHQMISTVTCLLSDKITYGEIIKATFPMASMTGAPKISAMKLLDEVEESSRNLYSGSIGYISPNGDFDWNVVIRSLLYNSSSKYLSYSTGGAITAMSDPEKEFQECLLKAKAIFD